MKKKESITIPVNNLASFKGEFNSMKLSECNATIFAIFGYRDPRYYIPLQIKNKQVLALIDSGSSRTYVGRTAAKLLGNFDDCDFIMQAANSNTVKIDGIKLVTYSLKEQEQEIPTRYVKSLDYDCIFGMDALKQFGITVDFDNGVCSLPNGKPWRTNFPGQVEGLAYPVIDSVSAVYLAHASRFFVDVTIKGQKVKVLVDSGFTKTYLGPIFEPILEKSIIPVTASV